MTAPRTFSETMAALREESGTPIRRLYDALVTHLTATAVVKGALKEGDIFPEFALPDLDGRFALLSDLLRLGPLVVNFYRGQWCQYCSATMQAMSAATPALAAAGATVIGISPEVEHLSMSMNRSRDINFRMLSDLDNGMALQCGLLFRLPDDIVQNYLARGLDLAAFNGNGSWFLPIPASYIVLPNGKIGRAYVNPDFRHRPDPQDILRGVVELTLQLRQDPQSNPAYGQA